MLAILLDALLLLCILLLARSMQSSCSMLAILLLLASSMQSCCFCCRPGRCIPAAGHPAAAGQVDAELLLLLLASAVHSDARPPRTR
jgi:hypothetical protein